MSALANKSSNGFSFVIDSDDSITYATAFNGKSIIRSLNVHQDSTKIYTNVTIEVSIKSLGQEISQPWKAQIGTLADSSVQFEDLSLEFFSEVLYQQRETVPAELLVLVRDSESVLAEAVWSVTVYSPDSWLWNESRNEILAAYVQPNHPILRRVLDEAVKILSGQGEMVLLSGYQIPNHVRPMVQAIYQAMVNQQITYSNPPASWDLPGGQRIRNPQAVLDEKVATCLDSAVLFASLLEAAGLNPVIALIPGHAFVGYWTAEYFSEQPQYPRWTELPIAEIMNAVDCGYIELFETTSICIGDAQLPYPQAIQESHARISGRASLGVNADVSTLINISACRMLRPRPIRPLPALYTAPDGSTSVVEYQPLEFNVALLKDQLHTEGAQGAAAGTVSLNVPVVVKRWLDSLLDLSARNPLINFKEPRSCVPLLSAPEILGLIEDLLQNKQVLSLVNSPFASQNQSNVELNVLDDRGQLAAGRDSSRILAEGLSKKIVFSKFGEDAHKANLRKMTSSAKTFLEETGSNGLYLALGSLSWTTKEGRKVRSPLILVPVVIASKNRGREFILSIDEGSQVMPNFSLAEKLFRDEGIKLDNLINLVEDESGVDVQGTFDYVRSALANAGLLDFRIDENAVLGFFNFSTYRLWRDLLDNWKVFENNALVKHFIHTPNQEFKDPSTGEIDQNLDQLVSQLPIPSDASQARAISHAMAGRTFILQGPPGTGKSQTITNLLARALSEGRRVLFVAEKKDALDVVKERLDAAGLGAFTLDLHDKGMNPKVVKEQLANVIDIAIAADQVGYDAARGEYESALTPLQNYRHRLHEIGKHGESIYSALDKQLAVKGTVSLDISGEFLANSTMEDKEVLLKSCKAIAELGPQTGNATQNPWSFCGERSELSEKELAELQVLARLMSSNLEKIQSHPYSLKYLQGADSLDHLRKVKCLLHPEAELVENLEIASPAKMEAQRSALESLTSLKDEITGLGIDVKGLESLDLEIWIQKANAADTSFSLLRSSKQKSVLKKLSLLLGTSITYANPSISTLLENLRIIKNRKRYAEETLAAIPSFRKIIAANLFNPQEIEDLISSLVRFSEISTFLVESGIDSVTFQNLISEKSTGVTALADLHSAVEELSKLLSCTSESTTLWMGESKFGVKLLSTIPLWVVDILEHSSSQLTRWIALLNMAKPLREAKLAEALTKVLSGEVGYADAPNAFLNGYYETLVRKLIVERGFNTFEAMTINNQIKSLNDSHNEIRDRLPRMTGSKLLASRGWDSSMKVGAIGDLVATLKQPKSRNSIRTLLAKHWGVIAKVTPCVLASPDSCVRFIDPALPPFDLVVFDEASQIRVANSIGAIGRAKAVIVVGDSKQMPPTSIAQVRVSESDLDEVEDEQDGLLAFDMESILDHCENARVPDIMLNWHYRSEDESLIAFSNKKYYDGKLNSFPSPSSDKSFKGLSFQFVPGGQFIRPENLKGADKGVKGTNVEEIDSIMKYLAQRLKDPALKNDSIGIVTFNKPQMDEIQKRLIDSNDPDIQKAMTEGVGGEEIFVKNLESVQGSERDVILFSVAFSKNNNGELPLNFGPLTNAGGERRLNVAITRARKQVRIFCSFHPDELLNRKSSSTGISHLAQYLNMASKEDDDLSGIYTMHESHPDRMRKEILNALRQKGLNAVEEVGLSEFKVDIAIYDPVDASKALVGILLDGPRWNSRETVSDRDCLSVTILKERMGWPTIERIWLASWIRNPSDEIERISKIYEQLVLVGAPVKSSSVRESKAVPIYTPIDVGTNDESKNLIDHLIAATPVWSVRPPLQVGGKEDLDYLYHPKVLALMQEMALQLTESEGPVSAERLAKYIGSCFGFDRVVTARASAINNIPYPNQHRDDEGFLFPLGETPVTFSIWRSSLTNATRHIQDISMCEISNAMKDACSVAQGMRPEQLIREVARFFGVTKISASISDRLTNALKFGLDGGKVQQSGDYIQVK